MSDCWSAGQIRLAIGKLSDANLHRLQQIAVGLVKAASRPIEPDELLNTALVKALEGSRTIPAKYPFVTVLAKIMRSHVSNQNKLHDNSKVSLFDPEEMATFVNGRTPEQDAIESERSKKLLSLFADSPTMELIFWAYYFEGRKPKDIAQLLDLTQTSVKSHLKTIQRRVKSARSKGQII